MNYNNSGNVPPVKTINSQKRTIIILLIALFVALAVLGFLYFKGQRQHQDIGFKTEEEVMEYFVERVGKGDFEGALKVFAVNHMAENYDLTEYLERVQAWNTYQGMIYSSRNPSFRQANRQSQAGVFMRQIANAYFSLYGDEEFTQGVVVTVPEGEGEKVAQSLLSPDVSTLKIKHVQNMLEDRDEEWLEDYEENLSRWCAIYGGEAMAEYSVTYEYNGEEYYGGVTLIQYDSLWYIYTANSNLAGTSGTGHLEKEFE